VLPRHPLGQTQSAINDLTNLSLASIRCEALGYNLSGGTLRLTDEVIMGGLISGANMNISAPVEIPGPTLHVLSTNSSQLTLSGMVNSPPGAVVTIDGGLGFRVSPASDYRAETRLRSGFLFMLFARTRGPLFVGGDAPNFASVALQSSGGFDLFPPLTILTNGSVINISTIQSVGALTVDGGVLRLGGRSPNGEITVNGPARLTGGAQLFVTSINQFGPGTLSVTGAVTLAGCSLAFQPGSGTITQPAIIVRNDGSDPVTGTFNGLPEGGVLTNDIMRYAISYTGGDGNDITLAPILEPARFTGATRTNGLVEYTVQGQPGFTYVIEATTNFPAPPAAIPWMPIRTNGTFGSGSFSFTDPDSTNFPHRFYRAVKP
jgi:hypothetical protein